MKWKLWVFKNFIAEELRGVPRGEDCHLLLLVTQNPAIKSQVKVAHAFKGEVGRSGVEAYPQLNNKFKTSLGYVKLYLKKRGKKEGSFLVQENFCVGGRRGE